MSEHRHDKCRYLVRGREIQLNRSVFRRTQERFERERSREIIPDGHLGRILNYLERDGFISRFRFHYSKIHRSGNSSLRTRSTHTPFRAISHYNILIQHRTAEHSTHKFRIFNAVHTRDAVHTYIRHISLSAIDFRPVIPTDLLC